MTPEQIAAVRRSLGLDQPVPVRYVLWLADLLQGNFGYSVVNKLPVAEELTARLGPTLILMSIALVVGTAAGLTFGVLAAIRQYSPLDYAVTAFSTSFIAIPTFVTGLVLIYVFGAALKVLPTTGMTTLGKPFSFLDLGAHLVMPVILLAVQLSAPLARYTRAAMLEVINADYVTTARAKGLAPRTVISRHAFRNAMIPVITLIGLYTLDGARPRDHRKTSPADPHPADIHDAFFFLEFAARELEWLHDRENLFDAGDGGEVLRLRLRLVADDADDGAALAATHVRGEAEFLDALDDVFDLFERGVRPNNENHGRNFPRSTRR